MSQIIMLELKKPTTEMMSFNSSLDITKERIRDLKNKKN
jgi:hypothetical protein